MDVPAPQGDEMGRGNRGGAGETTQAPPVATHKPMLTPTQTEGRTLTPKVWWLGGRRPPPLSPGAAGQWGTPPHPGSSATLRAL